MTDPTRPVAAAMHKSRRWMLPALVASLSLNLLVAGFILGHAFGLGTRSPGPLGRLMNGPTGPIGKFVSELPPNRRAALQDVMQGQRNVAASFAPAVSAARRELAEVLRGAPFERTKLEAALQKLADAEHALRTGSAAATSQLVDKLTDPERSGLEHVLRRIAIAFDDGKDPEPGVKAP